MAELPHETEFKLWLHPDDADAFIKQPRLSRAESLRQDVHTLYFDTPDLQLAKKAVALRVRKIGQHWLQTLKSEGVQAGGLSKRLELETPVMQPKPDFSLLTGKVVNKLIPDNLRDGLMPAYQTRFVRTAWNLRTPDGSRIEVALDQGEIISGKLRQPLCEVELELKSGAPDALFALAEILAQEVLLIPYEASKAARGAQLATGMKQQPVKATLPILAKEMSVCEGFASILRVDLSQLQANLPGLLLASDPEYCHQARVAIRRLRSAVRLFRKDCPMPDALLSGIASLGNALGMARDADVLVLDTLPRLQAHLSPDQFSLLMQRAVRKRRTQRRTCISIVHSPTTGACLIALQHLLSRQETSADEEKLGRYAARKLQVLYGRVEMGAMQIARLSPEERHALRISIKRLRYACEHFSDLLPEQKKFMSGLAEMQDRLGVLNDVAVAQRQIAALNYDGRLNDSLAGVEHWAASESNTALDGLVNCLQLFSPIRPI